MKKKRTGHRGRAAALMSEVNSAIGKPVLKLGDDPYFEIVRIPSGSLTIDRLTGGGFALGRHVELFGDESSCKSYISYRTMALSQARGNLCALVDPEHSFDAKWFRHLGGIPGELLTFHPESAEEAIQVMMSLALSTEEGHPLEVVVVDSVAALLPLEELRKDPTEEDRIAPQARMMSRALRRITAVNTRTLFLWTNQLRTKIGVMFGNPTSTPGGRALKFYDTTRIELKRGEKIKRKVKKARKGKLQEAPTEKGRYILCRSEKEKSSIPGRDGMFEWDAEVAEIVLESEIINLGLEDGFIERKGNTYYFIDSDDYEWSGQDREFRRLLRGNDGMRDELVEAIQDMTIQLSVPRSQEEDDG
jgi:recombination protein RecA